MHASGTRLTVVFDIVLEARLSILLMDKIDCLVLMIVSGKNMIMLVLQYAEAEIVRVRNIDVVV